MRKIKTEFEICTEDVFPPIPMPNFDWCAYLDGREEAGPIGWGETEAEALADLDRQLEEVQS